MSHHIDWDKARKRDLVKMWQNVPLDDVIREPEGLPELLEERAIEIWIPDTRPDDSRHPEAYALNLQFENEKKHTVVYHFIGITCAEARATFPSKDWVPSEVDQILNKKGYKQVCFRKEHTLEIRMDINVFPAHG